MGCVNRLDPEEILPLLARLARAAPPEATLDLRAPPPRRARGRARSVARGAVRPAGHRLRPDDDGAWAVLGLAQSLLGHYRFAARAYERALSLAPNNPWYAHNLGHLYDVALDRPADALPLLERATSAQPNEADIAASYAHALARAGKRRRRPSACCERAIRRGATADQMALCAGSRRARPRAGRMRASARRTRPCRGRASPPSRTPRARSRDGGARAPSAPRPSRREARGSAAHRRGVDARRRARAEGGVRARLRVAFPDRCARRVS